jgi:hypothetical protein
MSQEAAPPTALGDRSSDVRAQSPSFTATVDRASGTIRVRGHLDGTAVDLLSGSVVALQRLGHLHVVVRLMPAATVDAGARRLLAGLADRLRADGVRVEVRPA